MNTEVLKLLYQSGLNAIKKIKQLICQDLHPEKIAQHMADRMTAQPAGGLQFTLAAAGLPPHTFVVAGF
ncbi:hypothetical protein, partial [Photorhabdus viridis]|uniref:hypothetical protein n=1 Tax=Photorhabdus viridis TaxID=3163327 RepID=UPI003306CFBC